MTTLNKAASADARTMRKPALGWLPHDSLVVAKRHFIQSVRVPEILFFGLFQPVLFLLLFAYVFGGAIPVPGAGPDAYREFLIPGILAQTVAFAVAGPTVGIAEDSKRGIMDRFRSLPMAQPAVLVGRSLADIARQAGILIVLALVGLVVGWRINDGLFNALIALLILIMFSYSLIWVGTFIGLNMPSPEVANTAGLIWIFPLTFVSSALVPTAGMPQWLQTVALWNPLSSVALAVRELCGNPTGQVGDSFPEQHAVLMCVLWTVVLIGIFAPLSVRAYNRKVS